MAIEKPLKKSGNNYPRQFQSNADLVSAKGIAFEGSTTVQIFSEAGVMKFKDIENGTVCTLTQLCAAASDPFALALFDDCDPLFDNINCNIEILEECG